MVVAVGLLMLFAAVVVAGLSMQEIVWDGHKTIALPFVVVDAATGHPIRGATVRIREVSAEPAPPATVPAGEPGAEGTSDAAALTLTITESHPLSPSKSEEPIATPTEAAAKAGASLIPSPTMITPPAAAIRP